MRIVRVGLVLLLLGMLIPAVGNATPISIATASSVTASFVAANAIDGNAATFYSSNGYTDGNHTEWLQLDLGQKQYSLSDIRLTARPVGYGFPVDFKIQYSDDAATWSNVPGASFVNYSNPGGKEVVIPFQSTVNARYLRINATKLGTDNGGGYYLQFAEVKADQYYQASASSVTGLHNANLAIDGDLSPHTFYSSTGYADANHTEWLALDLGSAKPNIDQVVIYPRLNGYGFPKNFKIQYSSNGSSWSDTPGGVFTNYTNPGNNNPITIPFAAPVNARYIRLYATQLGSDSASYYLQLSEMQVMLDSPETDAETTSSVAVSSSITGWPGSYLSDKNRATMWSSVNHASAAFTESFTLQYPGKQLFNKLVLSPRGYGYGFPTAFKLQYSADGTTFADIPGQSYSSYPNPGSKRQTFSFEPVSAKALRVVATALSADDSGTAYYFQLAEASGYRWDTYSDTWAATDHLGRTVQSYSDFNSSRQGKYVGMFYFLWLGQHGTGGPYDITKIINNNTNAMNNSASPPWGAYGSFHHWGESQLGYYLSDDTYVLKKHAQQLADAGVDTLIFDVTNGYTYKDNYMALLQAFTEVRNNGGKTPQVMFLVPFGSPVAVVNELYTDLYGPGLYSDLWFRWEGKPLIMADASQITNTTQRNFFTYRGNQPSYFTGPTSANQWGWLETFPQHNFSSTTTAKEEMTVGVAQNAVPNGSGGWQLGPMSQNGAMGRSFHNGSLPSAPYPTEYGYNFAEQWGRALENDPNFIFVTGWNEWVAQRFDTIGSYTAPNIFYDAFNQEFSRDIEPMKGGYTDSYYYQLTDYIRKYKGIRRPQSSGPLKTIAIDGNFADWKDVQDEYRDDIGDAAQRNHAGWGTAGTYTNTTGRNDIQSAKIARDADYVYFYVKTKDNITAYTGSGWMRLFIKTNAALSNWEGYNFVVNRSVVNGTATNLDKVTSAGGWNWSNVSNSVAYRASGREMELAIPRTALGVSDTSVPLRLEFKWNDNMQSQGDVSEFNINGDTAPNGRFNYVFAEKTR
ncbi:discoidin domain-containing protein [Paenibacillus nasutitermitis]|uniref:F5/8 type C domain-containing protein n=1 Tax=Paenibacillus nasutitermitis TaxID=1652958 RepID=A0A917DMC8_9BACL|nr:discoidin domain-containing protein [Paenibacillus nasutitermitis]GGD51143.1 hypothetical protein GCM10010911_05860 [Paenibacillus nasutitermitis]